MKPKRYRQTGECPTPHKMAHETERDRAYWAKRMVNEHIARGRTSSPYYGYLCACGALHLTHRATWNGQPNVPVYEVDEALQRWAIQG